MLRKIRRIKVGKQAYRRLFKRVLERDSWRCQKCGAVKDLQVHHRIPRSRQGNDTLANLVTLCAYCHMEQHGQLFKGGRKAEFDTKAQGLYLSQLKQPRVAPELKPRGSLPTTA
jgi:5-methylcytosine-specific restriction endonuclease McrA